MAIKLDGLNDCVIGHTCSEDIKIIYSYEKMVDHFAKELDCSVAEAIQWVGYNVIRTLPYIEQSQRPIIISECSFEEVEEMLQNEEDLEESK